MAASADAADFTAHALRLFATVACAAEPPEPSPELLPARAAHCEWLRGAVASYRAGWLLPARAFFQEIRPEALPGRIVYPFGGGDLLAALAAFPDAHEITTLSLETSGDPRAAPASGPDALAADLGRARGVIGPLLSQAYSSTASLQGADPRLPGPLILALVALSIHGQEPVSLRYFELAADGSPEYLPAARAAAPLPKHMELRFRSPHDPRERDPRVYRHLVVNLDDAHLAGSPAVLAHLEGKGEVAALTKASSLLLWYEEFSRIRGYLLSHMTWMVSDYTGIPPGFAEAAGFEQLPYGSFGGLRVRKFEDFSRSRGFEARRSTEEQLLRLWRTSPSRELPFRFGYLDVDGRSNLLITRRRD